MDENIKVAMIVVVLIGAIIISAHFGGILSVIQTSEKHFRQESVCARSNVFIFDDIRIDYRTAIVDSRIINPDERERKTDCIPVYMKITEGNQVLFEYDKDNNGVVIDRMTPSSDYSIFLNDERELDDGSFYVLPNFHVYDIDVSFYTPTDTSLNSPYDSVQRVSGEQYEREGIYTFDLDNLGCDSRGYQRGSQLYFRIYPRNGQLDSDLIIEDDKVILEVVSGFPTDIIYGDVCMNYGVSGFVGGIQYDMVCLGSAGIIGAEETKEFIFDIPDTNVTEYYLRGDVNDLFMVIDDITTTDVRDADITRFLVDGNKIEVGNLIGDEIRVEEPVEEPVEESVEENPIIIDEETSDSLWLRYVMFGMLLLVIILLPVIITRRNKRK